MASEPSAEVARPHVPLRDGVWAAVVFAVLAAATIASPGLIPLTASLLPVPPALFALRHGRAALAPLGVGLVVAAILVTGEFASTGTLGLAVALLGAGVLVPALLVDVRRTGRLAEGGTLAVSLLTFMVCVAALAPVVASSPESRVRTEASAQIRDAYRPTLSACDGPKDAPRLDADTCEQLRTQRDQFLKLVDKHALPTLTVALVVFSLATGSGIVWLLRLLASRRKLDVAGPTRFREFRPHWTISYVLAVGLVTVMAAMRTGEIDGALGLAGLAAASGAGAVMLTHGIAVAAWMMARVRLRWWLRWAIWLAALLLSFVSVGVFAALALLDMTRNLRRRGPQPTL